MMRSAILACLFAAITIFTGFSGAHGLEGAHSEGYIVDILVIDLDCEENETCVSRPSNIVEYFGADWCLECPEVEQQLNETSNQSAIILNHRPSSSDDFWLPESRERFLEVYGLWGYPTLTIDGHYILAGPTQSRELDTLLSDSNSNYSGITNVSLDNNNLTVEGSFEGQNIDVWTISSNSKHRNLVTNHTNLSETNLVSIDGEKLVIVVSHPGYIALVSGSTLPANDYIPDGGLDEIGESKGSVKGSTIIIVTILLMMITLPATFQLVQIIRSPPPIEEE
tara:strand:- start:6485 stop:7327 length:843 start_codon:yes stop_codon:yes gene_type:complete